MLANDNKTSGNNANYDNKVSVLMTTGALIISTNKEFNCCNNLIKYMLLLQGMEHDNICRSFD